MIFPKACELFSGARFCEISSDLRIRKIVFNLKKEFWKIFLKIVFESCLLFILEKNFKAKRF